MGVISSGAAQAVAPVLQSGADDVVRELGKMAGIS
jgi:hypothetical protein